MTGGNMSRREKIIIFAVAAVCLVCSVIFVFIPKKAAAMLSFLLTAKLL